MAVTAVPVRIHIVSHSIDHDEEQQQQTEGQLFYKKGSYYLRYEEKMDDDQTGNNKVEKKADHQLKEKTDHADREIVYNTLKVRGDACTVIRHGTVHMNHVYREGKQTHGQYHTPYGSFQMTTKTEKVRFSMADLLEQDPQKLSPDRSSAGWLTLLYSLDLNEQAVGRFQLQLHIQKKFE